MIPASPTTLSGLGNLLDDIERYAVNVSLEIGAARAVGDVPAAPGWYTVRTTATLEQLLPLRPRRGTAHYHIRKRLERIGPLAERGLTAGHDGDGRLPVYSGHAKNLKARVQSHLNGHAKTGCLSLLQYAEALHGTEWSFRFTPVSAVAGDMTDCEPIRILGEQLWRARFGWPVLCHK
jgi:hypothetical protein